MAESSTGSNVKMQKQEKKFPSRGQRMVLAAQQQTVGKSNQHEFIFNITNCDGLTPTLVNLPENIWLDVPDVNLITNQTDMLEATAEDVIQLREDFQIIPAVPDEIVQDALTGEINLPISDYQDQEAFQEVDLVNKKGQNVLLEQLPSDSDQQEIVQDALREEVNLSISGYQDQEAFQEVELVKEKVQDVLMEELLFDSDHPERVQDALREEMNLCILDYQDQEAFQEVEVGKEKGQDGVMEELPSDPDNKDREIVQSSKNSNKNKQDDEEVVQDIFKDTSVTLDSDNEIVPGVSSSKRVRLSSDPTYNSELSDTLKDSELSDDAKEISFKRKRRRIADMTKWKDNTNKKLRERGKQYMGWKRNKGERAVRGPQRKERKIGPPCISKKCTQSKTRQCQVLTEDIRKSLFIFFWESMTWDQKKIYIKSLVKKVPTKRKQTSAEESRRKESLIYKIKTSKGEELTVCKKLFLSTFGLGEWTVLNWVRDGLDDGMCAAQERKNSIRLQSKVPSQKIDEKKKFLGQFLDELPKLPSHYCRQSTSKLYLEPTFLNGMTAIYNQYILKWQTYVQEKAYVETERLPLSKTSFDLLIKEKNIAFQPPKKDRCDTCIQHELHQIPENAYHAHDLRKKRARQEKENDKNEGAKGNCVVFTQDVQAVKTCPMLNASALYYKTKLCSHNFTIFNITSHHVRCYWFTETEADLTANTFSSCVIHYLNSMIQENKVPIILWSDGCAYQNRNAVLSNALLSFSYEKNVTIYQKFLEPGHTQMEADSVHAAIERKLKNQIVYLPSDYHKITVAARKNPPYEVHEVTYDFVKDYSNPIVYDSIRPGRKPGEPVVNDIKVIKYSSIGIQVKTDFDGHFIDLPRTRRRSKEIPSLDAFQQLRNVSLKISKKKWLDLQQLKAVIPQDCHSFYDGLSHED